jgi:hypothetical protein
MDHDPKSARPPDRARRVSRRTDLAVAVALTLMAAGFLLAALVTS